ncbi:MAG: hypothetical protein ACKOEW_04850 [Methylocystis sp.]
MTAKGDSLIKIEASDLIHSDIQEIWRLMSEVNRWPEWNKSISFAQLEGVFVKGSPFKWTCGVNNRSILEDVIINKRIVWSTKSVGVKTLQRWDFKKTDESVLVSVSQSAEGWLTKIASQAVAKKIQKNQQEFLLSLKHTAEKA